MPPRAQQRGWSGRALAIRRMGSGSRSRRRGFVRCQRGEIGEQGAVGGTPDLIGEGGAEQLGKLGGPVLIDEGKDDAPGNLEAPRVVGLLFSRSAASASL